MVFNFNIESELKSRVAQYRALQGSDVSALGQEIIFARKISLIEFLLWNKGLTFDGLDKDFAKQNLENELPTFEKAWVSHLRQLAVAETIRLIFPSMLEVAAVMIFNRDASALHMLKRASIVVTASGDEFVKTIAQHIGDETALVAVNSDPETSDGALTICLEDLLSGLASGGNLSFTRRTRIEAVHNGQVVGSALDSIFIGSENRRDMSALTQVLPDGRKSSWKSSGIVFYPGAGSTGWPLSASGNSKPTKADGQCSLLEHGLENTGAFVVTEPFRGRISNYSVASGLVMADDTFTLESLLQSGGLLEIDGITRPFAVGERIEICLSDNPQSFALRIAAPNGEFGDVFFGKRVFFAHEKRISMSRYRISIKGSSTVSETQKSSGICFVAAGTESHSVKAAIGCSVDIPESEVFSASADRFDMLVTEPREASFCSPLQSFSDQTVEIEARVPGQKLIFDGYSPYELPQWERVGIRLADRKVVSLVKG
jgi:hypothetical protein